MPFAVTHMLVPMILLDIIRDNILKLKKKELPNKYILLAGISGLIPDVDVPLSLVLFRDLTIHRTLAHSLLFPLIFLIVSFIFWYLKNKKWFLIFLACFIGFTSHIILDFFLLGTVCLFCPFSAAEYGLNFISLQETEKMMLVFSSLDAVLLWIWFFRMEFKKRIQDFF